MNENGCKRQSYDKAIGNMKIATTIHFLLCIDNKDLLILV